MVRYLPRKVSATKPPRRHSMKEVPTKLVTILAEVALPKCMVPVKYVTKLTAMPNVVSLSHSSTPEGCRKSLRELKTKIKRKKS